MVIQSPMTDVGIEKVDSFGCITVESASIHDEDDLKAKVARWTGAEAIRGVWLHVRGVDEIGRCAHVALKHGFRVHHGEGTDLIMKLWAVPHEEDQLPSGRTHTVGVGAFVYDLAARRVLVVSERLGPTKGKWKVPTGLVNVGEDLEAAAVREVREETGVETVFRELVAIREAHDAGFGASNM